MPKGEKLKDKPYILCISRVVFNKIMNEFEVLVLNFDGKPLLKPRHPLYAPQIEFTDWHIREVFQGKYSYTSGSPDAAR